MTLSTSQLSDIARLPSELNSLVNRRIELASLITTIAFPAGAEMRDFVRGLEETQRQFDETSRKYKASFQEFMALIADPGKLEDEQLEHITSGIAELDKGLLREAEAARRLIGSSARVNTVRHLLLALVAAGPDVMFRLRKCVRQSVKNGRNILEQTRRWQDEMLAMQLLVELGRRRPLTTEEKIQLTQVSVIDTPVIQDPSDCRVDWYDDDGRVPIDFISPTDQVA